MSGFWSALPKPRQLGFSGYAVELIAAHLLMESEDDDLICNGINVSATMRLHHQVELSLRQELVDCVDRCCGYHQHRPPLHRGGFAAVCAATRKGDGQ